MEAIGDRFVILSPKDVFPFIDFAHCRGFSFSDFDPYFFSGWSIFVLSLVSEAPGLVYRSCSEFVWDGVVDFPSFMFFKFIATLLLDSWEASSFSNFDTYFSGRLIFVLLLVARGPRSCSSQLLWRHLSEMVSLKFSLSCSSSAWVITFSPVEMSCCLISVVDILSSIDIWHCVPKSADDVTIWRMIVVLS